MTLHNLHSIHQTT